MAMSERAARALAGLLLVPSMLILGVAAGGAIASLTSSGMGWDRMADALGGIMIGAVAGPLAGIVAALRAPAGRLRALTIGAVLAALLVSGLLTVRTLRRRAAVAAEAASRPAVTETPRPVKPPTPTR